MSGSVGGALPADLLDGRPAERSGLLVKGGTVYTADQRGEVHSPGSVLVVGDQVAAVGDEAVVEAAVRRLPPAVRAGLKTVDARSMMVLPGFVNPHWHELFAMRIPYKGATRSAGDRDDMPGPMALGGDLYRISGMFDTFHGLGLRLTPEESEAVSTYSMWTQLRSGTTTIGDVGSICRPEALVAASRTLGMRAMVSAWSTDGKCVAGEPGFQRTRDAEAELERLEEVLKLGTLDMTGLVRAMPTAVFPSNMSDELGRGLAELADHYDTPFASHIGALRTEAEVSLRHFGISPLRRMDQLGLLNDRLIAVHCSYADPEERRALVRSGAHINHSPAKYASTGESIISETRMISELMAEGVDVSLSTDGLAFPAGGMPEAMRAAWQAHNELTGDNTTVRPTHALAMATSLAARALRWDQSIGSLEPGKQADLVLVPTDDWRYLLNPRPLEAMLTLGGSIDVHTVVVAGRVLLSGGRSTHLDEQQLQSDYLDALASFSTRELGVSKEAVHKLLSPYRAEAEGSMTS